MDTFLKIYILIYMAVFFLSAMVLPSYLLYKRTGINPVTFGKGADTAHDYIGLVLKIILLVVAVYGLCNIFMEFERITLLDSKVIAIIGFVLSLVTLVLIIVAQKTMADSWRIGIDENVKTKLVTGGLFKYLRNPIFSGVLLLMVCLFLIIPTYFMLYMVILSYLIISIQVRLEEEFLAKIHGKEYIEYKIRVGRFLPKLF